MENYTTGKLIGKGSFGEVFLCQKRGVKHQYVMKKMRLVGVEDKEMQSFQLEVQLLSELAHPGIVEYVESFVTRDHHHLCIVMGYCEGGDLTSFLKKRRGRLLPEKDILNLFVQMTLALHFVHMKNILHRDLKSQNIFLKDGMIQLGDFGISKVLETTGSFAQTCIGTPYYMSPELFQNKKYNFKSDVWALGCVLYEMATLKHAFDANSINGLAMKIIRGKYPKLSSTYSRSLHSLVASMLTIEPRRRPSIKKILNERIVQKRLKLYISKVFRQGVDNPRKTQALTNARTQLNALGMSKLLEEIETAQKQKAEKKAEGKMEKRWKEQEKALQKEEIAHRRMEEALRKYKEQQQRLKRRLLEQKNRASRRNDSEKRRSTPAERRQQKRLEEANKRRKALREKKARLEKERAARLKKEDEQRRKREADRKKVRELSRWGGAARKASPPPKPRRKKSSVSSEKRSVMAEQALKKKRQAELEIEDSMEDNQDDLQELQRAREELERHLQAKDSAHKHGAKHRSRPSRLDKPVSSDKVSLKKMSPKDRVLYEKENRRKDPYRSRTKPYKIC
uniref:non-specific serine/threonine protein kinase n=1 Tax=Lotharella globosa TaxID=91324 RepID=A0A7S3YXB3_9EUKA